MHKVPRMNEFGLPSLPKVTPELLDELTDGPELDRRDLAAAALAAGATVQVAARLAGVTIRQVYRWKNEPGFQGRIEAAFRAHVEALKFESLRTIRQLLRKGPPEVRERLAVRVAEANGALPVAQAVDVAAISASNVLYLPVKSDEVDEPDEGE